MGPRKIEVDPDYTDGNLILVDENGVGFAIHDYFLRSRSLVFREMLNHLDSGDTAIDIPATHHVALFTFVDACSSRIRPTLTWTEAKGAITLCEKYDRGELSRNLLFAAMPNLLHADFCPAFIAAARLNEVGMTSQLLAAHGFPDVNHAPESPSPIPFPDDWPREQVKQIPVLWYWALVQAKKGCSRYESRVTMQPYEYWLKYAAAFTHALRWDEGG